MEGPRKRKPLSDITDTYDLIPTSVLRKLVADSVNPSSFLKPPISILKSSSVSSNQKLCSESSNRSDTSIGSSNFGGQWSSRTVQFRTPPFAVSSIARAGGRGSKNAAYNQAPVTEKSPKEKGNAVVVDSPSSIERRKRKGKAIAEPFSSSPTECFKENQNENRNTGNLLERERQPSKAYRNIFSGLLEIEKGSNKGTLNPNNSRSYGKAEKGKGIIDQSLEKTKEGKAIIQLSNKGTLTPNNRRSYGKAEKGKGIMDQSLEETNEGKANKQLSDIVEVTKSKGLSAAETVNTRPPRRKSVKRKPDAGAFSCPPMTRSKVLQTDLDEAEDDKSSKSWTDPHLKMKKKRLKTEYTSEFPREFIEQQKAYFKEIDDFELPEEEISQDELD